MSDASEIASLEAWCSSLLTNLSSSARRSLARDIARELRPSQAKRIAAQQNPEGSKYEPRKPQKFRRKKGSLRRTMFAKMRTSKFLKTEATPEKAVVKFAEQVQRIGEVHQFGLRDKVNRRKRIEIKYPSRQLLGITDSEKEMVKDQVINHLAK